MEGDKSGQGDSFCPAPATVRVSRWGSVARRRGFRDGLQHPPCSKHNVIEMCSRQLLWPQQMGMKNCMPSGPELGI